MADKFICSRCEKATSTELFDSMFACMFSTSNTHRGRSRGGSFNTDLANLGVRVVPGSCMTQPR